MVYFHSQNVCSTLARNYWRLKQCLVTWKLLPFYKNKSFFTKCCLWEVMRVGLRPALVPQNGPPPTPSPAASRAVDLTLGEAETSSLPGAASPSHMFKIAYKYQRRRMHWRIILWSTALLFSSYVIVTPYPRSTSCKKYFKIIKNITR